MRNCAGVLLIGTGSLVFSPGFYNQPHEAAKQSHHAPYSRRWIDLKTADISPFRTLHIDHDR